MDERECLRLLRTGVRVNIEYAWRAQINHHLLWRAVREAAASRDATHLTSWGEALNTAQNAIANVFGKHHVTTARALLWCGEQAATRDDRYRTEIDRAILALASPPELNIQDETWAWVCIRTLLEKQEDMPTRYTQGRRRVDVPVAGWNGQKGENGGFLATLVLEVLDSGAGQVAHHPIDAFETRFDKEFGDSMKHAWAAAREQAKKEGVDVLRYDGRWRLLQRWSWEEQKEGKLLPAAEANDRSASGAAAWGWYFALTGKVPDSGIIMLAQVREDGMIAAVDDDGVSAKTKAIAADGHFDTIVVASTGNSTKAEAALSECKIAHEVEHKDDLFILRLTRKA
jgi:hypothetical protein